MPVYLIRHAHAGSRAGWGGDDDARPLSPKGRAQTTGLTTWLADQPVDEVRSSPSARCRQTVEPLAASHGLEVESDRTL
ncbi:MAG: SixA phosphatase family protein, partial [Acidimicrobiales bacterium]